MYEWGAYGATYGFKYTWMLKAARLIGNHLLEEEGDNPRSIKALLNKGMKSLQELGNVYDYVKTPMSSIARSATRRIVGPIVEPLFRRSPAQPPSDSDHDPTAASSNQPQALPARPRRPKLKGKQNEQGVIYDRYSSDSHNRPLVGPRPKRIPVPHSSDSDNKPLAQTNPRRNPVDIHRSTPGRVRISGKKDIHAHLTRRSGSGMPAMTPALVNYAPGVRQSKCGGGKTITTMAPILEFNEAADDPYVMRQLVR